MPVVFILLLPVAFAASVKRDDHADNAFTFTYNSDKGEIVTAASSTRHSLGDDVSFFVFVAEAKGASPLVAKTRLALSDDHAVRYNGTMTLTVEDETGRPAFKDDRSVSFTLRPKPGKKVRTFSFPFDVPSGDYGVTVKFSR